MTTFNEALKNSELEGKASRETIMRLAAEANRNETVRIYTQYCLRDIIYMCGDYTCNKKKTHIQIEIGNTCGAEGIWKIQFFFFLEISFEI